MTTKTEAAHEVRKVLEKVRDFWAQPGHVKLTEADTRAHFIDPLLRALGYDQIGDVQHEVYLPDAKQFLDYELFVGGKPRVSVEAKALDVALSETHRAQVVQYCSVLGIEWAVVTNARQWRLYHVFAKGPLAEKRLLATDLLEWDTDDQYDRLFDALWLISKESFAASGGPNAWLAAKHLDETLTKTLTDPTSPEIKVLRKRLQERDVAATPEEIALWFKSRLDGSMSPPVVVKPHVAAAETSAAYAPGPATAALPNAVGHSPTERVDDGPLCFLTPVKDEEDATVRETLESLLGNDVYVFGDHTAGRAVLRAGDRICFYHSRVGVVADAEIASTATKKQVEFAKSPDKYPWAFAVKNVHFYFDSPVLLSPGLRGALDAFAKHDPNGMWSWFVQGTRYVTAHDFARLTGTSTS